MNLFFFLALFLFFVISPRPGLGETPHGSRSNRPQAQTPPSSSAQYRFSNGEFQYLTPEGKWKTASAYYKADKNGTFLNSEGENVEYSKGDIIFKKGDLGWFKAKLASHSSEINLSEVERLVIELTNNERIKRGLRPLTVSTNLQNLSRLKAQNMARSRNLSHGISPLPPGGENIAWNQATAQEVVRSWMNSSGHRANILSPQYSVIGVGVANGNGPYWAQMFQ
jgi:uncharacterized protein YkwD